MYEEGRHQAGEEGGGEQQRGEIKIFLSLINLNQCGNYRKYEKMQRFMTVEKKFYLMIK